MARTLPPMSPTNMTRPPGAFAPVSAGEEIVSAACPDTLLPFGTVFVVCHTGEPLTESSAYTPSPYPKYIRLLNTMAVERVAPWMKPEGNCDFVLNDHMRAPVRRLSAHMMLSLPATYTTPSAKPFAPGG